MQTHFVRLKSGRLIELENVTDFTAVVGDGYFGPRPTVLDVGELVPMVTLPTHRPSGLEYHLPLQVALGRRPTPHECPNMDEEQLALMEVVAIVRDCHGNPVMSEACVPVA